MILLSVPPWSAVEELPSAPSVAEEAGCAAYRWLTGKMDTVRPQGRHINNLKNPHGYATHPVGY